MYCAEYDADVTAMDNSIRPQVGQQYTRPANKEHLASIARKIDSDSY